MTDCVIVGAGVIGMLTALELAEAGQQVVLLERQQIGRESSWAGGGILSPLYPWRYPVEITALAQWGQARFPQRLQALAETTGIDPEFIPSGLLILDEREFTDAATWANQFQYTLERLQASGLKDCEPQLNSDFQQAMWMPEIGQARNPRLVKALRKAVLEHANINTQENARVIGFTHKNGKIEGVKTETAQLSCSCVVVASGAWSGQLLAEMGIAIKVEPVRGQIILYKAPAGLISHIILHENHYVIPRKDGRVLVGSTLEKAGFEKQTTSHARVKLQQIAAQLVPELVQYPIEHQWAGLRPSSPNSVPYIGEHPHCQGLYVNSGHFRNGVVLSLASVRLLADMILQRPPILDPAPYALEAPRVVRSEHY
ncbi:glycine oxidase ThiO [Candidatus Venteria ishoeyi]|uniref:Hydrogen cyanide synthase subunit HcnC n=1 Tax=Candidatus Venteria ishoeyi TaxID=1899563 RepID=A0A1H6F892_9GAMM|nr:glycine oxidase ThiO [Candidatus Venteria ishoeyi]SEH05185.1 Hydrogen cyanide synthase subunit HcnC precursor [Candidatus Venteria ishoeyi]